MALRLGIVGCGNVTQNHHLPALKLIDELEVVALADADAATLEAVGNYWQINQRFTAIEEMLNQVEIDAVAVCVPASAHATVSIQAIAAHKHVYIEKPLALTLEDCDQIIAAAAAESVVAMVGFNLRFHRQIQAAKQWIQNNPIEDVHLIQSHWTSRDGRNATHWKQKRETGGGAFYELAIHHADLWHYLLQGEIGSLCALHLDETDTTAMLAGTVGKNTLVSASFSQNTAATHTLFISATSGVMELQLYRFDRPSFLSRAAISGGAGYWARKSLAFLQSLPRGFTGMRAGGEYQLSYRNCWLHFKHCIDKGNLTAQSPTLADGRAALAIVNTAIQQTTD